ncbi:MAG: substrate-binding domain-containing protein [Bacteroidetes bacterium]|nr:substrate-binding domain-containing protein [Bacteroidota bacterium]
MKQICKYGLGMFGLFFIILSCNNDKKKTAYDSATQGTIHISVDESFEPVISEQIKVYEFSNPKTHIIANYKPEADCFRDLANDSIRMVIVAKGLSDKESKNFTVTLGYKPTWDIIAYDAVAVIINKEGKDSVFTMKRLKNLLNGSDTSLQMVVDGNNATSTVRYLLDSVVQGNTFGKNVEAAKNSMDVINFISKNQNAVGFVGSSWVVNEDDPAVSNYTKNVRFALLACDSCGEHVFAKPSQATIMYDQYPLVRPLYYILKENAAGLGSGFVDFMMIERGQLIFNRSYLVPAKIYFGIRKAIIDK